MGFSILCILASVFILQCLLAKLRTFEVDVEEYEQSQGETTILPPREQNALITSRVDDDHF